MSMNTNPDIQKKIIKDYWLEKLSATAAYAVLPDTVSKEDGHFTCTLSLPFTPSANDLIKTMAKNNPVTEFIINLSLWGILLYKYFNAPDLLIVSPGLLENTDTLLFYSFDIAPGYSLKEIMSNIRSEVLESFSYADYNYEELKAAMAGNIPGIGPVYRYGIYDRCIHGENRKFAQATLQLVPAVGEAGEPCLEIVYNACLYEEAFARQMAVHYARLLENVRANLDKYVFDMEILSPGEKRHIIEDFNDSLETTVPLKTIPVIFQEQAVKFPGRIAAQYRTCQITYRTLDELSNQVAHMLTEKGVQTETLVGIKLERSLEMIAGILGILKSGGAYLPMDPDYPPERIDYMLKDSNAKILIIKSEIRNPKFESPRRGHPIKNINDQKINDQNKNCHFGAALVWDFEHLNFDIVSNFEFRASNLISSNIAYIIYTSGSTGKPKGVMVEHRNVVSLLFNEKFPFRFNEEDTWSLFHSMCFDFSVWELFGALLYGGRSIVVPLEIARTPRLLGELLQKNRVTVLNQIPTMFYNLAQELLENKEKRGARVLYLRYIVFGGETLNPSRLSRWLQEYPGVKLINMYGITETTVHVTYKEINKKDIEAGVSPIGKPLAGWSCHILDAYLRVVPPGIPGEILVGGEGVARGYLNRVELTHERFIKVPGINDSRLYRSGDSGRRRFDGSIEYLGRIDEQVKIRGFRIECGEIETCLLELERVKDVAVVAGEGKDNNRYLAAYIVTDTEDAGDTPYRDHLESRLPEYMIPQYFVGIDKLPLTPSGKVDKKALPQPGSQPYRRPGKRFYEAPANEIEKGLANIWQEVLGVEQVGVHDNFFSLGGDSIKGIHVINKIQYWLQEIMHVSVIFEAPTIRELAVKLESYHQIRSSEVDEAKVEKFLDIIRPLPAYPARLPKNPPMVFVLSSPRSGSTLLRVIMAGHPQLFAPPELELLSFNTLRDRKAELSGRFAYFAEGTVRAIMELNGCDAVQAQTMMAEFENSNLPVQEFYRVLQGWLGDRQLVDKTPFYTLDPEVLKRAEAYFESAKYIHLIRNPYASIHSFEEAKLDQIFRYSHSFTVRELAELVWLVTNRNIREFLKDIPQERQLTLKFEDLAQDAETSVRGLCKFLGIEFYPGMIQVYGNLKGKMVDGIHPESKMLGDIKFLQHKAIDPGVVNRWKENKEMGTPGKMTLALAQLFGYGENQKKEAYTNIMPVNEGNRYRLSHAQKRMWLLEQFDKERSAYNISGVYLVEGVIDRVALENAFASAIKRHESLRTVFDIQEGEPVQEIRAYENLGFSLVYTDMRGGKQNQERARLAINEEVGKAFDLVKGPLLRAGLIHLDEGLYVLYFILPHIISDGWSMGILLKEFITLYSAHKEGKPDPLPPLRIQYKDFCQWQGKIIDEKLLAKQENYWLQYFKETVPILDLPTDYPRPVFQSFNGGNINFELEEGELTRLKALSQQENVTLFMVLLTAYSLFLSMITGREDMVIGTPIAGRNHEDLRPIIGMFVNTLALRVRPIGGKTVKAFLSETRQCILGAFENQDYPFETLVEQVAVNRDVSRNPIFDVAFALQGMFMNPGEMPDLRGTELDIKPFVYENKLAKFDMGFYGAEVPGKLVFSVEYCTDLFKRETVERFTRYFKRILAAITDNPAAKISSLEIISQEEKEHVLYKFNNTAVEYPREKTIHYLFAEQAERNPDHIAIVGADLRVCPTSLTYRQLNEQSGWLAGLLIEKGVLADDIVAVKMKRSIEMVIAILGTLKAGCAYLPIDPDYPQERIEYMLKDSAAGILLTDDEKKKTDNCQLSIVNRQLSTDLKGTTGLAYIIYTSGSTGKPKGVMVEHRSVVRLVINNDFIEFSDQLRVLQTGAPVFDAVTFEMWGPLLNGGQLYLVDNNVILDAGPLGKVLKKYLINTLWLTSSLFNQLAQQHSDIFSTLNWLVVGGDVLAPRHIAGVKHKNKGLTIVNGYGPTENTTFSVCHRIERDYEHNIPIGKPIANSTAYIFDKYNRLQPVEVPGELHVGGDGLARGYLNNPELTAEKFKKHRSYRSNRTNIFYRTGDLARWLPGGIIEFLGRIDHQIKIRGFRVELGEIEQRLIDHEEIAEAIVIVLNKDRESGDTTLCAYFTGKRELSAAELRSYLEQELPRYMIPAYFVQLAKMPLTVNGKIDRLALPVPQIDAGEIYIAPIGEIEEKIVEIWASVLGIKKEAIGVNDDFFHLGGHSLKATLLASQVSKMFNVEFPLTAVFTGPTVREMGDVVRGSRRSIYEEIKPVEKRDYYPLSSAQKRLFFLEQLENIGVSYNIPAVLKVEGELDKFRFKKAVDDLISRHEALRTSFCLVDNEPVQVIHDWVDTAFILENSDHDLQDLHSTEEILAYAARFIQPFDISCAPLLRIALVALKVGGYFLFYDIHHIICDGTSLGILITDFIKLYFQEELLPLKIQYKDFTLWQNHWFESGTIKKQQEYWLNVYRDIYSSGGKVPRLNLPTDYPRPETQSFSGEKYEFKLEKDDLFKLNGLSTRYGTTLYMNLLAIFYVLLFKYTDREDIIVGSGIGERTHADMQGFLGMSVNTLAMRNHPQPGISFTDFLKKVKENCIQAFENQDMQFEELVERLEIKRDPSHNPLFDVEFNLQNFMMPENEKQIPGLGNVRFINLGSPNKTSKFDIILFAQEVGDEILFILKYTTALFKRETIKEIARHYIEIIKQITSNEEIVLKDICISHDFATALPTIENNEFGF